MKYLRAAFANKKRAALTVSMGLVLVGVNLPPEFVYGFIEIFGAVIEVE